MLQPVDREAAVIAVEQAQMAQHPVGQLPREGPEMRPDRLPVGGRAFVHRPERRLAAEGVGLIHRIILSRVHRGPPCLAAPPASAYSGCDAAFPSKV